MINLMPPDVKSAMRFANRNTLLVWINLVILAIAFAIAGVLFFGVSVVRSDENNLKTAVAQKENQLATFESTLQEAEELASTIETISTLIDQEEIFSELLQQIGSLMPDGSKLTALTLSNDRSVPIQITADTDTKTIATTLQNNLASSELFIGADIQNISANLNEAGNPVNYSVVIIAAFQPSEIITTLPPEELSEEEVTP